MAFDSGSPPFSQTETLFAEVIVPRHIAKAFTYRVPLSMVQNIQVGSRVRVPFGQVILDGVVISLSSRPATEMKAVSIKSLISLVQDGQNSLLSPSLLKLSNAIAQYYVAPWGQCLRLICSPTAIAPIRYVATQQGRMALEAGHCPESLRPTLLRITRRTTGILSSTLQLTRQDTVSPTIDSLLQRSWVAVAAPNKSGTDVQSQHRKPTTEDAHGTFIDTSMRAEHLPAIDASWRTHLAQCFQADRMTKIVLHAPLQHRIIRLTDAIQQAYSRNKSTIVVCGETAKASWLKQVLMHLTGLPIIFVQPPSASERSEPCRSQTPSVMVGTRSAIFASLNSIGLIWVEGEDDAALKEPQEPRYHAREVACLRADADQSVLILASAHPSLESRFDTAAEIHHVQQEVDLQPAIELVDLRKEPRGTLFSRKLISSMSAALQSHNKIVLFLNKKGYAAALVCQDCGWVPRCSSCVVPLTYSREAGRLTCRYCGMSDELPEFCSLCHASRVSPVGDGTERVEAETHRLFPRAKIARLDGNTLQRRSASHSLWERARSGACDILIGTEALFRREPLPQHGVVGILQADSGLHVPDFRAAERTYQLLVDAVNLARPASAGGRVIVQTRLPSHHAIQAVLSGNPHLFYDEEYAARRLLNYPPICHLAELVVAGDNLTAVEEAAQRWCVELQQNTSAQESLFVLGPVSTIGGRLRGRHHRRIMVRGINPGILTHRLHDSVQSLERQYRKRQIKFVVDMDPVASR